MIDAYVSSKGIHCRVCHCDLDDDKQMCRALGAGCARAETAMRPRDDSARWERERQEDFMPDMQNAVLLTLLAGAVLVWLAVCAAIGFLVGWM